MLDITEIIEQRKYYFSLQILRLYNHLLHREVPLIPAHTNDNIWMLYDLLDKANDCNYDWAYTEMTVLKFITRLKIPQRRINSEREFLKCGNRHRKLSKFIIWEYPNGNIIARTYESFDLGELSLLFRYAFYENLGEFLFAQMNAGVALINNPFLVKLADEIYFENWIMNKFINQTKTKNS